MNFGTVLVGASEERTISVTANGTGAVSGEVRISNGVSCGEFTVVEGAGSYNLAPGQSRAVTVKFTPLSRGNKSCVLEIGSVCDDVAMVGWGDTLAVCDIDRVTIDFGSSFVGDIPTETFTLSNVGGDTLAGDIAISSDVPCDGFTITSGGGPYELTAGESRQVTVAFDPVTSGPKTCRVETGNDATCSDVDLTGYRYPGWVVKDNVDWGQLPGGTSCYCAPVLEDVVFSSSNMLYAIGWEGTLACEFSKCKYFLHSRDGGSSWKNLLADDDLVSSASLSGLSMKKPGEGVAVGDGGTVLLFVEDTYLDIVVLYFGNSGTIADLYDVSMVGQHGIAVGSSSTVILTSDGGLNWTPPQQAPAEALRAVDMIDATTATAVGPGAAVLRTLDGGDTWTSQSVGFSVDLRSVDFVSTSKGWIVGDAGRVFRTTDGGSNWSSISPLMTQNLLDVSFVNENDGVIVGDEGVIWRTLDGGDTWRQEVNPVPSPRPRLLGVSRLSVEVGLICGDNGTILMLE